MVQTAIRRRSGWKQETVLAAVIHEQEPDCAAPEAQLEKATLILSKWLFFFHRPPAEKDKISVATAQRPCREIKEAP